MAEIIWTEPALQELDEIADYISLDNPIAAKNLVRNIVNKVESLSEHPRMGKSVKEIQLSPYRELVIPPCRIFYRIDKERVFVVFVMREERNLRIRHLP